MPKASRNSRKIKLSSKSQVTKWLKQSTVWLSLKNTLNGLSGTLDADFEMFREKNIVEPE